MDFDFGRLSTLAIILCGGGLLLLVVIVVAARAFFSNRSRARDPQPQGPWQDRGQERPQYDSDRVESSGGFGNAPSQRTVNRTDRDRDRDERRSGFGSQGESDERSSGLGSQRQSTERPPRRRPQDKDDDVQSKGGFGG